jgi:hypothetical protein
MTPDRARVREKNYMKKHKHVCHCFLLHTSEFGDTLRAFFSTIKIEDEN